MRKINMKRRSKKQELEPESESENNLDKSNDTNSSSQDETENSEGKESEAEPETKKKKSEKRKSVSFSKKSPIESSDEEADYEVEQILDEKLVRGVRHYLIRWKGYEPESDSWEPELTLNCPELIKQFKSSQDENADENGVSNSVKKSKSKILKSNKKVIKTKKLIKTEKKKTETTDADWDSNEEFEVDRIIDVYFKKTGQREFLVSWKGYPNTMDSWEPEENLTCSDLIKKFMSKVDNAKNIEARQLRVNRPQTERLTLRMYEGCKDRRLSRRLGGKQRIQYHDAE